MPTVQLRSFGKTCYDLSATRTAKEWIASGIEAIAGVVIKHAELLLEFSPKAGGFGESCQLSDLGRRKPTCTLR